MKKKRIFCCFGRFQNFRVFWCFWCVFIRIFTKSLSRVAFWDQNKIEMAMSIRGVLESGSLGLSLSWTIFGESLEGPGAAGLPNGAGPSISPQPPPSLPPHALATTHDHHLSEPPLVLGRTVRRTYSLPRWCAGGQGEDRDQPAHRHLQRRQRLARHQRLVLSMERDGKGRWAIPGCSDS